MDNKERVVHASSTEDEMNFITVQFEKELIKPIRWWQFWRWHRISFYRSLCRDCEEELFRKLREMPQDSETEQFKFLLFVWWYYNQGAKNGIYKGTTKFYRSEKPSSGSDHHG